MLKSDFLQDHQDLNQGDYMYQILKKAAAGSLGGIGWVRSLFYWLVRAAGYLPVTLFRHETVGGALHFLNFTSQEIKIGKANFLWRI